MTAVADKSERGTCLPTGTARNPEHGTDPASGLRAPDSVPPPAAAVAWHPWQQRLWADHARVIVVNWHRQAGKDFCAAAKAVDHALRTGQPWFLVSITQRQADATFEKCKQFARLLAAAAKKLGEIQFEESAYVEWDKAINHEFRCTARTLRLPGGGSVTSLPGRDPDTLAGLTGNVVFTEFGLFPRGGYDHWRVVFPLSTRGYQVIVISTPRGRNTKFAELASETAKYSYHLQPITRSVAEGFVLRDNRGDPCTLDEFRALYGDDVGWRREYLCEFSGDLEALVSWALLQSAGEAGQSLPFSLFELAGDLADPTETIAALGPVMKSSLGRIELGWDVARRGHLSSLAINAAPRGRVGGRALRGLVLMRGVPFAAQRAVIDSIMRRRPDPVGCGDATGLGMDSNETLARAFGARWRPVTFTAAAKREIASGLATAFADREQTLPPLDGPHKCIATDLYAIQADRSGANLALTETENPLLAESHCDIAYSIGLARLAAGLAGSEFCCWAA